jgi:hypothetical protein
MATTMTATGAAVATANAVAVTSSRGIQYQPTPYNAREFVERLLLPTDKNEMMDVYEPITIPPHQREFCWTIQKQYKFLESIQRNYPVPSMLTRKHRNGDITLEDGGQRARTLKRFFEDKCALNDSGLKYSALSPEQQRPFNTFTLSILQYSGGSDKDAIRIFDSHQNGTALTVGERLYAYSSLSPIVKYTFNTLLVKGQGFHDRAEKVWGPRFNDNRRTHLKKLYALCAGLAFGPEFITVKWEDIMEGPNRNHDGKLTDPIDVNALNGKLNAIFTILERAQVIVPKKKKDINKQFDPGYLTGYIAYSLYVNPTKDIQKICDKWTDFIVDIRKNPLKIFSTIHKDISAARSWNSYRWKMGYLRVFEPTNKACIDADSSALHQGETEDEEEDDESQEES